jgi:hypothetical protein
MTNLSGRPVIRAVIVNHRTTKADVDRFVVALHEAAGRLACAPASGGTAYEVASGMPTKQTRSNVGARSAPIRMMVALTVLVLDSPSFGGLA